LWVLCGLLVIGALLRFVTLGHQSYWFDEAQAAHELGLSFGAMVSAMISHESNPPLYFVVGWVWAKLFGTGAVGLRSLSALAGVATIALTYLGGRELVSERAGLVAAALVTISPFMIWYSQEAREYMLLAALCGASVLFFARSLRRRSSRDLGLWALFSALAILTYSFAGFLIAPEAVMLLYAVRRRDTVAAVAVVAIVQAALLPLILGHASNSLLSFIRATPLHIRIEQVPITFGFGTLYMSASLLQYSLLGGAVLVAALILLLVTGAPAAQLRGAGIAAVLATVVLLAPLLLALAGVDYYLARALMPAWIPLAIVIGAACTAPRARVAGAALAVVLVAAFVYAQVKIQSSPQYQRPNWRGVAAALGSARGPRAIVLYNGLGTDPLATYLPRVPWTTPSGALSVDEVDVIGNPFQRRANPLPPGVSFAGSTLVDGFVVDRFAVAPTWTLSADAIAARAAQLLTPAPAVAPVLFQRSVS
jgi:uncharacterized membrane protein